MPERRNVNGFTPGFDRRADAAAKTTTGLWKEHYAEARRKGFSVGMAELWADNRIQEGRLLGSPQSLNVGAAIVGVDF